MTTSVPSIQFNPTGLVVPTDAEILAGVQNDQSTAFGGNLNPALETPQGQLASSEAAVISDKNSQIALIVNQVNPDYADGRFQDAIGRIYFQSRIPGSGTIVTATVGGLQNTIIPIGATAKDTSGNLFTCTSGATIGVSGTATCQFTCNTYGPIAVPIGALNSIAQLIPGWDTITNAAVGILGRLVETRQEFETRRAASVALNANGTVQSVIANVRDPAQCPGVLSAYGIDNPTDAPVTIGAVTLAANSIYVAVEGGVDTDIAYAIWRKKSGGCSYNGNTSVVVYDTDGYQSPYPQTTVKFTRPTLVPIFFDIQLQASSRLPKNINTLIQDAIVGAFSGLDGGPSVAIGATMLASRYATPISATDPNVALLSVQIGTTSPGAANYIAIGIDEFPTIDPANITITQV